MENFWPTSLARDSSNYRNTGAIFHNSCERSNISCETRTCSRSPRISWTTLLIICADKCFIWTFPKNSRFFHKPKIQDIYCKDFSYKSFRLFSQDKWSLINNTRIRSLFYRSNILGSQSHPYLAKKVSTEKVTKITKIA